MVFFTSARVSVPTPLRVLWPALVRASQQKLMIDPSNQDLSTNPGTNRYNNTNIATRLQSKSCNSE